MIVGVGAVTRRPDEPELESVDLMAESLREAGADAGPAPLLSSVDQILVPKGTWGYPDPGRLVAERAGCGDVRTVVAELGVSQTQLVARACDDVASGRSVCTVVVGGEARFAAAARRRAGNPETMETAQEGAVPDERWEPGELIISRREIDEGLVEAVHQYALLANARRAALGQTFDDQAAEIDALWREMANIAVGAPTAWDRQAPTRIDEAGWGRVLATPYRRDQVTQWTVDQAAAIVVCAADTASSLGVPVDRWVFPHAVVNANHVVHVLERERLERCQAFAVIGRTIEAQTSWAPGDISDLELYSCFPVAVQVQRDELGLGPGPSSLLGGMTFGGGPFNNFVLCGLAAVVRAVRESGDPGMATGISGMLTKQGAVVVATAPKAGPVTHDVTNEAAAATGRVQSVDPAPGPATIVAATVLHGREGPERAVAVLDAVRGDRRGRVIASSFDAPTIEAVATTETHALAATIDSEGRFAL